MPNFPGLGTDIELDKEGNFVLTANGDLSIVEDEKCILQGVIYRLLTPNQTLFYDLTFGLDIYKYIHGDNDKLTQIEFVEDVKEQLRLEPRIKTGTEDCQVLSWTESTIVFKVSFIPIEMTTPVNLVLFANMDDMEMIVKEGE